MVDYSDTAVKHKGYKWPNTTGFLRNYWTDVLGISGDAGLAITGVMLGLGSSRTKWIFFCVALAAVIIGRWANIRKGGTITGLEEENDSLRKEGYDLKCCVEQAHENYYDVVSCKLARLANSVLGFSDTERISLYKHDGRVFILIGRYSKNPNYDKRGRQYYPADEGCIAKAWENGSAFIADLPDPQTKQKRYYGRQRDYGVSKDIVDNLTMLSRTYAGYAIEDREGRKRIAVIVFESTTADTLDDSNLNGLLAGQLGVQLQAFLDETQQIAPTLSNAAERGF